MKPLDRAKPPTFEVEPPERQSGRSYGHPYDKAPEEKPLWRAILRALTKRLYGKTTH